MDLNRRLPRVDTTRFSMIPRADVPRSTFVTEHYHKTTFNAGYLVPIFLDEVLPADVHRGELSIFARLATPLYPIMDNIFIDTFFFFVPNRILWTNWVKMMGERANPSDSISYTVPTVQWEAGGAGPGSLWDYFGLMGTVLTVVKQINCLPFRAYNRIWNDWFRDQNLQNQVTQATGDGPDTGAWYTLLLRNKRADYFTSALPWPLKGGVDVTLPLAGNAKVATTGADNSPVTVHSTVGGGNRRMDLAATPGPILLDIAGGWPSPEANLYADLSTATGATINALRLAFTTQALLERDARSGTRYTELLRAHFGIMPEDARLQRPEYIGGGSTRFNTQAIPQTSATGLTGGTSALGSLGAAAVANDQHSFSYSATEHGYILGLVNVRADLTYQQGMHRMWSRSTRYDFYWPAFANLGEQAIRNEEIYVNGDANDTATFGYQERWAEYRHRPSRISGLFRSTAAGNIDEWHLSEQFGTRPALNSAFIQDAAYLRLERAIAAGPSANNMQILFDSVFKIKSTRPLPMYSIPGMMGRF